MWAISNFAQINLTFLVQNLMPPGLTCHVLYPKWQARLGMCHFEPRTGEKSVRLGARRDFSAAPPASK
jgi:hypothetical protein